MLPPALPDIVRTVRFDGRVAIVTGASSGIGEATARLLAAEGARVVVTARRREPLERVAEETNGVAVAGDAAEPAHARDAVEAAVRTFGGVDVVVSNAATGYGVGVADVEDAEWTRTIETNLGDAMRISRGAIPSMLERGGGSIVFVSSVLGLFASTASAAYGTSKTALIGLARSIAVDYGPRGVRANVVCPGWVATPMGDRAMRALAEARTGSVLDAYREATRHVPLRRAATPEEIARCIAFLASDDASIVTGAVLTADGGQTAVDLGGIVFDGDDVGP
jgi:meso-butanediol dehydrogenase / (S,S)-butanediol dehydrogenase / diacetyl reductase